MVNFIHFADLHANKARRNLCVQALNKIGELAIEKEKKTGIMPHILFAGDFFDSMITNTEGSGFSDFIKAARDLNNISQVYMISGTPTHDVVKSWTPLEICGFKVFDKYSFEEYEDFELVAMPEPRKANFLNLCENPNQLNEMIIKETDKFVNSLPNKKKPRVCVCHNEVESAVFPNGVSATSPIAFTKKQMLKVNADYYAYGHIHNNQKIEGIPNCYYSGSIPPKGFGETHSSGVYYVEVK